MRVLVIDDDFHILKIVEDRLKAENFEVIKATDGIEGLRMVFDFKPDIVLLDIMMPTIDGHSVLHCIKKDEKTQHIPIMMMTARRDRADVLKAASLGAADYIIKPIDFRSLVKKLRDAVEQSHNEMPLEKRRELIKERQDNAAATDQARELMDLATDMEATAASTGIAAPPPQPVDPGKSFFKFDLQKDKGVGMLKLIGEILPGDVEKLRTEFQAVLAKGDPYYVIDTTGLSKLDPAAVMQVQELLNMVAMQNLRGAVVDSDRARQRYYRKFKIQLEYPVVESLKDARQAFGLPA